MKKKVLWILSITTSVIIFSMFFVTEIGGIQTISTSKETYSVGEEINIHFKDFRIVRIACSPEDNSKLQILKNGTTGWSNVNHIISDNAFCIDGNFVFNAPCDHGYYYINPIISKNFTWSRIYEYKGDVDSCLLQKSNEIVNGTMKSYESKNIQPGVYMIKFGNAQKTIEVV